jgi:hypothetical protein
VTKSSRGKYDRSQSTSERHEQTHEKLLDDATEVFAARGYRDTRVDDLVEYSASAGARCTSTSTRSRSSWTRSTSAPSGSASRPCSHG